MYNKGELFYEFKGLLDEKLHDHKLDLLDFKPYWQLDNIATKQVQVLTDNMNKTRQLATELDSLRDQLKSLFSQIDDEISREDHHLGAIQNDYVRGNITEICYHEELDKINRNIAVLKGRIDKLKALE